MPLKNDIRETRAQCQIVWFKWKIEQIVKEKRNFTPVGSEPSFSRSSNAFAVEDAIADLKTPTLSELSESDAFDISDHLIQSCTFRKNTGAAAGAFNFRLDNTRDWKNIIKPGQWCLIFMSNEGDLELPKKRSIKGAKIVDNVSFKLPKVDKKTLKKNRLRGICYIERVTVNTAVLANGALDVIYEVSGRDYGVVYEETNVWYNYFKFEEIKVRTLSAQLKREDINSVDVLISLTHDLFFAPQLLSSLKAQDKETFELTEVGTQWLLPKKMLSFLDVSHSGASFYGNINPEKLKRLDPSLCRIPIMNPLDYINDNVWSRLKDFSIPRLHELFTETDNDGHPQLIFRPIPWGINPTGYPQIEANLRGRTPLIYLDLVNQQSVDLFAIDLIDSSIGEDNHNRYNHFFTTSRTSLGSPASNISILKGRLSRSGKEYPHLERSSIRRHGFQPMHVDINTFHFALKTVKGKKPDNANGRLDADILLEYNELVFDYWNNAVLFETGNMRIIGNNDIKVGKVLKTAEDVPYHANKVFYIEEYMDEFTIGPKGQTFWTQNLQLTRGIELKDLQVISGFGERSSKFVDTSDFIKD